MYSKYQKKYSWGEGQNVPGGGAWGGEYSERQLREASRKEASASRDAKEGSEPIPDLRGQHQGQRDRSARVLSRIRSGCSRTARAPLRQEQRAGPTASADELERRVVVSTRKAGVCNFGPCVLLSACELRRVRTC